MAWYPLKGDGSALWGRPFFDDEGLNRQLAALPGALWRAENGVRYLALPYSPERPFPLTELFCLARVESLSQGTYVVYRVDGRGEPVMPSHAVFPDRR